MKIICRTNERSAVVTIDTQECYNHNNLREAVELALQIEGYDQSFIQEFFGRSPDVCAPPESNVHDS